MKRILFSLTALVLLVVGAITVTTSAEVVTDSAPAAEATYCTAWGDTQSYTYRCYLTGIHYEFRTTVLCYSASGEIRVWGPWVTSGDTSTAVCPNGWNAGRLGDWESRPFGMGGSFKYWFDDDTVGRCYTYPNRAPSGANQSKDPWACGNRNLGSSKGFVLVTYPGDSQSCYKRYFSFLLVEHDRAPADRVREVDWSGPLRYTC